MWKSLALYLLIFLSTENAYSRTRNCFLALRACAASEFECQAYPDEQFSFGTFLLFKRDPEFKSSDVSEIVSGMLDDSRSFLSRARGFQSFPPEAKELVMRAQSILAYSFPKILGVPFLLDLRDTVMITPERAMQADRITKKAIINQDLVHKKPMEFLRAVIHENIHLHGGADEVLLEYDALPLLESITEWLTLRSFDVAYAAGIGVSSASFEGSYKYRGWVKEMEASLSLLAPLHSYDDLKLLYVTGDAEPLRTHLRQGFQSLPAHPRMPALDPYIGMLKKFATSPKQ